MRYQKISPPSDLSHIVKSFWVLEGEAKSHTPLLHRLMADCCIEWVFQYKNQFWDVGINGHNSLSPRGLVQGPMVKFREMLGIGHYGVFGVCLYPYASSLLFDVPAKELSRQWMDIQELMGREGGILTEQMVMASSTEQRLELILAYLTKKCSTNTFLDKATGRAIHQIFQCAGNIKVAKLASILNLSSRQLERKFAYQVGLSPKVFARIARFQESLKQANRKNLTDLAYESGYSDQSHFIREFKAFAGLNPAKYFNFDMEAASSFVQLDK